MADPAGTPPREAMDYLRRKRFRTGWDYREVWREEHSRSFTVANMMQLDLLRDVRDSLNAAQEEGVPFARWKAEMAERLSKRRWWGRIAPPDPKDPEAVAKADLYISRRLETIWRVNMGQAAQAGTWERGQRSASHPYVLYRVGPSREHRAQHLAWDGTLLPKEDPFWRVANPRNGWGCKCYTRFVSRAQYRRYVDRGISKPASGDGRPGTKKVKTTAPELEPRNYYNPRTRKTYRGVEGIDPGFERNPGVGRDLQLQRAFRDKVIAALPPARPEQEPVASRVTGAAGAAGRALTALGGVHGVRGKAPDVSAATAELPTGLGGQYETATRAITVDEGQPGTELTFLHELGHYVDFVSMRTSGAAEGRAAIEGAIKASAAWREIMGLDPARRRELVQRRELWAGAYAQWAAWRSGDDTLLDQVDDILAADHPNHLRAWSAQDFAPIAEAFDGLMIAIGWMSRATE